MKLDHGTLIQAMLLKLVEVYKQIQIAIDSTLMGDPVKILLRFGLYLS